MDAESLVIRQCYHYYKDHRGPECGFCWMEGKHLFCESICGPSLVPQRKILTLLLQSFSCRQTAFILNNDTIYSKLFPVCQSDSSQGSPDVTDTYVLIRATLQDTLGIESSVRATVAMATWLAMIIHGLWWVLLFLAPHIWAMQSY